LTEKRREAIRGVFFIFCACKSVLASGRADERRFCGDERKET
jgi:hypothetical protein